MSKIIKPKSRYTSVPNELITDNKISTKAKAIYCLLASKPDGWDFYESALLKEIKEGKDFLRSALRELQDNGWIKKMQPRTSGGRFSNNDIYVTDKKWDIPDDDPTVDGFSDYGEPATSNNNISKTDNTKTYLKEKNIKKEKQTKEQSYEKNGYTLKEYLAEHGASEEVPPAGWYESYFEEGGAEGSAYDTYAAFTDYFIYGKGKFRKCKRWKSTWANWYRKNLSQRPYSQTNGRSNFQGAYAEVANTVARRYGRGNGASAECGLSTADDDKSLY